MKSETGGNKRICVLSGMHRGAVVGVGDEPVLFGDRDDCDALLADGSVAGSAVRFSRDAENRLLATSIRGEASRNGRKLRACKDVVLKRGSVIGLGDVRLAIGEDLLDARSAIRRRKGRRILFNWAGGAIVASLVLFGFFGTIDGPMESYDVARAASPVAFFGVRQQRPVIDPVRTLMSEITRSGLSDSVTVASSADGRIVASGAVTGAERARWNGVVRWFDGRFGGQAILESRLSEREDGIVLPFEIVAVHASSNPRVVIQNGHAYSVGAILPGGWEVRRIAQMTVVLARGDRELAITF